jgi:hypothetical protein
METVMTGLGMRIALLSLLVAAAPAHGEATDFLGNWDNPNRDAGGLSHVVISPNGGDRVDVRAYGECHPNDCNWGLEQGKVYTAGPKSKRVEAIVVTFHFGFAHHRVTFRKAPGTGLTYEMLTDFVDGSDKRDFVATGTLQPSAWAGPLSQNWERPAELRTGWGGGPREGEPPKPAESCLPFDTKAARAVERSGSWKIVVGADTLAEAGNDEASAMLAEAAIHHYRFDRRCTVGGPWKTYWKSGNGFASDRMGGAECIAFNPTTVHLARVGREWKIVDGVTWIAELGDNKAKADATLALIRTRNLTAECFVRRQNPVMVYWLTR